MIGVLLAVVVAQAEPVERSPEDLARRSWLACLVDSVRSLDDGISDAQTIARAVVPACSPKWQEFRAYKLRAEPKEQRSALMEATEGTEERVALTVVLASRKADARKREGASGGVTGSVLAQ